MHSSSAASIDPCVVLDAQLQAAWKEHLERSPTARRIRAGAFDVRLYAIYLLETFHYTRHNARNQALVGVRAEASPEYLRFCFRHALEETGHELMALHDLQKLELRPPGSVLPSPLPETEVLTAYLYWVSAAGDPLGRLGYSFWAEDAYRHVEPLLAAARQKLGLTPANTTFLMAHASIDEEHSAQVRTLVRSHVRTPSQLERVSEVMRTSLALHFGVFDALDREYRQLERGEPSRYRLDEHAAC